MADKKDKPVGLAVDANANTVQADSSSGTATAKGKGLLETLLEHLRRMPKLNKTFDHTQQVAENDEQ